MRAFPVWLVLLVAFPGVSWAQPIEWHSDYVRGRLKAIAQKKLVVLVVHQEGCLVCVRQEKATFGSPKVEALVRSSFVAIRLEAKKDAQFVRQMKVETFPTTVIATPEGTILRAMPGNTGPSAMLDNLTTARSSRSRASASRAGVPYSWTYTGAAFSPSLYSPGAWSGPIDYTPSYASPRRC